MSAARDSRISGAIGLPDRPARFGGSWCATLNAKVAPIGLPVDGGAGDRAKRRVGRYEAAFDRFRSADLWTIRHDAPVFQGATDAKRCRVPFGGSDAARLAERDLAVPFSVWRQQARVLAALPMLVGGGSVTEAALTLGYDSPSAFASMFRRMIGAAPAAYRARNADPAPP
ncbi:helix-turn-helix domain-containing protein [Methylobacterium sp. J-072]|uniref:helix-turn-helix domain-containing protein n=1 Tax=Methylobacterium sp. J-072 TaxID=2836651 RepID=UPI001FB9BD84|nr:helix-turn-helix domain-containing protein [Methylobacterium sp. J-072]MCJ2094826.1 helix-turn-helix domain-containing protein [Methylobacterium sp. J-072]